MYSRKCVFGMLLFCFVLFVHICFCTTEESEEDIEEIPVVRGAYEHDDVLVLSTENFDDVVNSKDLILVEFYAPWCGHCKTLAPEYAKAAKALKENKPSIPLAKVDATIEDALAKRFQISGFPTLLIFHKGQKMEYDGPRTAEGIVEYMQKEADPNWKPPPTDVLVLTADNFTKIVDPAPLILVEFYAPWCGHCRRLAPEYERAARVLKSLPSGPILLAKVDSTQEKELTELFKVTGYPTLLIFRHGKSFKYTGPREEAGIIHYMSDQAKPPSLEVTTSKQLDNNLHKMEATVIGLFKQKQDPLYQQFMDAANQMREELTFLHSFQASVAKHLSSSLNTILIQQPAIFQSSFEPRHQALSQVESPEEIVSFLEEHRTPLVGLRSSSDRKLYRKYPLVVVYYDVDFGFENRAQTQLVRTEVLKVAAKFAGQLTFAICKEDEFAEELKDLGLDDSGEDVNVGYFSSQNVRYRMDPTEDFDADQLKAFVQKVQKGKVARQIRSQPIPKAEAGPVTVVVGKTFQKLVTESPKHVLLELYAPWCQHCKKLEPVYKKVAKTLAAETDSVVVAKMDGTLNDIPEDFEVPGYPTIYFVKADGGEKVQYQGTDRTHDDLVKFVQEQLPARDEL